MDQELKNRLDVLEKKVDAVHVSAEKTRKYFLAVLIITVVAFVLPLVGLLFAIPSMLSQMDSILSL